ncbi:MAG: rhamnulokinase [Saccharofermentanales bacterium]
MGKKILLGFDYGASSGRAIVAVWENGKLALDEVHRFANEPVMTEAYYYWDTLRLFHELKEGIRKAIQKYGKIDSIGIDTWGVDYALLAKDKTLLTNPIHYRDDRTAESIPAVHRNISFEDLYKRTGLAQQTFNTIYQLYSEKMMRPELFSLADKVLYTPDFFAFLLTGEIRNEYTIASTGGLVSATTHDYDPEILEKNGFSREIFPKIIYPGETVGMISPFVAKELEIEPVPVIAVCSHDTASAVLAVPMDSTKCCAYLSCGTWSLIGIETDDAICTKEAMDEGFTNEGGAFGKTIFLKNITGLWLMQSLRKNWAERYEKLSYDFIENQARISYKNNKKFIINPNDPRFNNPLKMIDEIAGYCEEKGQGRPVEIGDLALAIYNGLVNEYAKSIRGLEVIIGSKIEQLNMVGGGIQDKFLSELTYKELAIPVVCGPIEGSAAGNFLMQLVGIGQISTLEECRKVVRDSFDIRDLAI